MAKTPPPVKKRPSAPRKTDSAAGNGSKANSKNHRGNSNGTQQRNGKAATAKSAPSSKPVKASSSRPPKPNPPVKAVKVHKPRTDLSDKIVHMIAEEMAIEEAELTPTANFKEDLKLDEIDIAELLMQAEGTFGVHPEFNENDWDACETVDDFVQMVQARAKPQRAKTGKSA